MLGQFQKAYFSCALPNGTTCTNHGTADLNANSQIANG